MSDENIQAIRLINEELASGEPRLATRFEAERALSGYLKDSRIRMAFSKDRVVNEILRQCALIRLSTEDALCAVIDGLMEARAEREITMKIASTMGINGNGFAGTSGRRGS